MKNISWIYRSIIEEYINMKKTALLLDINDTLDDGREFEERKRTKNLILRTGVLPAKDGIEEFAVFLHEYNEKLITIFWTSVWLRGQDYVAKEFLGNNKNIVYFDSDEFMSYDTFNKKYLHDESRRFWGVWTPKTRYFLKFRKYIWSKIERTIWFEDSLNEVDKAFVDKDSHIKHIGFSEWYNPVTQEYDKPADTLKGKIEEIKAHII